MMIVLVMGLLAAQANAQCVRSGNVTDCRDTSSAPMPNFADTMVRAQASVPKYQPRAQLTLEQRVASLVKAGDCERATKVALDGGSMSLAAQVKQVCAPR